MLCGRVASTAIIQFILSLSMAADWESENLAAILHRTTEVFVDANLPGVSAALIFKGGFRR